MWGDKYPLFQLRFVPGDSQSSILVNGIQYHGCIEIYAKDGKFNIINEVDVETYLKKTLSHEFSSPLHDEVMHAIAIAARTHAYFISQRNQYAFWHVKAEDVGYQGTSAPTKPHVEKAVDSTYHAVLKYKNHFFAAAWTQNSAGKTADFASIFRKPFVTPSGVTSEIALKDREQHRWSCVFSKELLAKLTELPKVTAVDLYVSHNSGKVYAIKVSSEKYAKDYDFPTFQRMIGKNKLRSNDFKIEIKGNELVFSGYGEGPGVGLCIYSAKIMADQGKRAPEILQTFFPETELEKVKSF
jgi:stage II sporulation protein D